MAIESSNVSDVVVTEETAQHPIYNRLKQFAQAVKNEELVITNALARLVGDINSDPESASSLLSDVVCVPDSDLVDLLVIDGAGPRIPSGLFNRHVHLLRGSTNGEVLSGAVSLSPMAAGRILPQLPDDTSFLELLKTGGISKIDRVDVYAAVRGALASNFGFYELPEKLTVAMERHAEALDEPCSSEFYRLRKMVTQKSYGELFAALGVDGNFVSKTKKKQLVGRVNEKLWPALKNFHDALASWQDTWLKVVGNPAAFMGVFAATATGGISNPLLSGLMQPPDTNQLRIKAEAVIDTTNRVFAGHGIPVARALAWEAQRIQSVLSDSRLPNLVGAANREEMLKLLGVSVAADIPLLERDLSQFTLAVMELPRLPHGNAEYAYIGELIQLGNNISWSIILSYSATPAFAEDSDESEEAVDEDSPPMPFDRKRRR